MAKTINQLSQNLNIETQNLGELIKAPKFEEDFTLFICNCCKRQCALLTKETDKSPHCPFFELEIENSSHIFKF